ncbi:MAG: threonine-phosphate decarboxylase [Hyphomicrobiaceae bacterium]|nr:threonine-phosphate decarboxylase [Hyphomicrobiaceae bacterium]
MRHGGDLSQVSVAHNTIEQNWLDLSTGIAPVPYPLPTVPLSDWQRLPQDNSMEELIASARHAYKVPYSASIIAAPGTQILIQLLPILHPDVQQVRILGPTYNEHAICWGRSVKNTQTVVDLQDLRKADVRVITNPNNPDGRVVDLKILKELAEQSYRESQLMIVDEAFADITPEVSIVPHCGDSGLIVLRSFGKFYGLAGLRLGFAIGAVDIIKRLGAAIGPWAISGPACYIAKQALYDDNWARKARLDYKKQATRLDTILIKYGIEIIGGTSLFRLGQFERAAHLHNALAKQGIWTRKFCQNPCWLRFGLPGHASNFIRFETALIHALSTL